jgi:acetyltransferase
MQGGAVLGVVHHFADPDRLSAEYAIAVRSDWHGHGVGYLLMNRIIEVARQYGIGELTGEVLHENRAMLAMCRELGFALAADPDDPSLVRVTKRLPADPRQCPGAGGGETKQGRQRYCAHGSGESQ